MIYENRMDSPKIDTIMIMRQSGFILFVSLVFLLIFTLTSLYTLQQASNALKLSRSISFRSEAIQHADEVLNKIENHLIPGQVNCHIPVTAYYLLVLKSEQWWHVNACLSQPNVAYVVEDLGEDPCALVGTKGMAAYYRITLTTLPMDVNNARILLQSILVKAVNNGSSCPNDTHHVSIGRQMIREL